MLFRLGNAIDVNNEEFKENLWPIFKWWWSALSGRIKFNTVGWEEAKEAIISKCDDTANNAPCIGMRLLFHISKKNYNLGAKILQTLTETLGKKYFLTESTPTLKSVIEKGVLPVLKQAMLDHNITSCTECYDWETSSGGLHFFTASRYSREIGDLIAPSPDEASANRKIIQLLYEFYDQFDNLRMAGIKYTGNFLTYTSANPDFQKAQNSFFNHILVKHLGLEPKEGRVSLLVSLLMSFTTFEYERLSEVGYDDVRMIFTCEPFTAEAAKVMSCNQGSFQSILTLMKQSMYHPHVFDLNLLLENNFTGNIDDLPVTYPDFVTQNLTQYPLRKLRRRSYEPIAVVEPFIPFCQLANAWSNIPKWGSKYLWSGLKYKAFSEFCTLFRPTMTDKGICYSFNAKGPSENMLKPSEHLTAYKNVFGLPKEAFTEETYRATGIGLQSGIRIVLDAHTLTGHFKRVHRKDNTFKLSIQHPKDFPLPVTEGIEIKGGYKTT